MRNAPKEEGLANLQKEDYAIDTRMRGANINNNLILYMPMWSLEMEKNWAISVTQSPNVEACFLDLIEGNDPESRARLPLPRRRPPGATPPLTAAVVVAVQ